MSRIKVAVLFGGSSNEHEISRMTAMNILEHIPSDKYEPICIGITKKGHWLFYPGAPELIATGEWEQSPDCSPAILSPDPIHRGFLKLENDGVSFQKVDVLFPVLHGKNGEDGSIQGLFELSGIPYVGCGVAASAACMDKETTHTLLEACGIKTAKWRSITQANLEKLEGFCAECEKSLGFPVFVKPANCGSSIGISKVTAPEDLETAVKKAFTHDNKVLVEEMVYGRELECAVFGGDTPTASVPGEIAPTTDFYDYEAKYVLDTTSLFIPARTDAAVTQRVRETAVKAFRVLGCYGLARVDFFLTDQGQLVLNEVNTMPGFTNISMYPKLMEHEGTPYGQLLDNLIQLAFDRAGVTME